MNFEEISKKSFFVKKREREGYDRLKQKNLMLYHYYKYPTLRGEYPYHFRLNHMNV